MSDEKERPDITELLNSIKSGAVEKEIVIRKLRKLVLDMGEYLDAMPDDLSEHIACNTYSLLQQEMIDVLLKHVFRDSMEEVMHKIYFDE